MRPLHAPAGRQRLQLRVDDVEPSLLDPAADFVRVYRARKPGLNLSEWLVERKAAVRTELLRHGAVLFSGFAVHEVADFEATVARLSTNIASYTERAATRTAVGRAIYTSTELAPSEVIPLHHEMSYSSNWPRHVFFYCKLAAAQGGCTPIGNERRVLQRLSARVQSRFREHGVMYVRNHAPHLDPWTAAYQTNDRSEVERYLRERGVAWEWLGDDGLRTRQVRAATAHHPELGLEVWFNHAHMFHYTNMRPELLQTLLAAGGFEDLPRNALYGDGKPIEPVVIQEIHGVLAEESRRFPWCTGDVLVLDNYLASHGRDTFVGPRQIYVAMTDMVAP